MPSQLSEHPSFQGTDGKPLVGGKIFIGTKGQDPTTGYPDAPVNLITIYAERALTTPLSNPETINAYGRSTNKIWIPDEYSLAVWDANDVQTYLELDVGKKENVGVFDTMADFVGSGISTSLSIEKVTVLGFHAPGDGGGGDFYPDATQDRANHNGGTIIDPINTADLATWDAAAKTTWFTAGTGTGCWISLNTIISAEMFGAKGDNSEADAKSILAAIGSLPAAGGDVHLLSDDIYLIDETIALTENQTGLIGQGAASQWGWGAGTATQLKWNGAAGGTVLNIIPSSLTTPIIGARLKNLSVNGDLIAAKGILIQSAIQGVYKNIHVRDCTTAGIETNASTTGGYSGSLFVSSSEFNSITVSQTGATSGDGILLSGSGAASSCTLCTFSNIHIYHDKDSDGIVFDRADTNVILNLRTFASATGGTGYGLRLKAKASGATVNTNFFMGLTTSNSNILSEGSPTDTYPAKANWIYGLLLENTSTYPTIETGSTLLYQVGWDVTGIGEKTGTTNKIIVANGETFLQGYLNGTSTIAPLMQLTTGDRILMQRIVQMSALLAMNNNNISTGTGAGAKLAITTAEKLGFWGKTPIVQPSANADTSGATLVQLETEVNELKQLLRDVGLMA